MTDKIVSINKKKGGSDTSPPEPPVNSEVVEALEEILENAKLGYITELVGIVGWANGELGAIDVGIASRPMATYGALTHLSLEYRDFYLVEYEE